MAQLSPEEQFWNEMRCAYAMQIAAIEKRYPVLAPANKTRHRSIGTGDPVYDVRHSTGDPIPEPMVQTTCINTKG